MGMAGQRRYQQAAMRQSSSMARALTWLRKIGKVLARLSILAMVSLMGWAGVMAYRWLDVPVATVAITTPTSRVTPAEIETLVSAALDGGFLSLDLDGVCATLTAHPWIAEATARRYWPDRIEIAVVEEVPIARWGKHSFLNQRGQTLDVEDANALADLPYLFGPAGSMHEVMREYRDVSQLLLAQGLKVVEFGADRHYRWRLRLDDGFAVLLGEKDVLAKVRRFLRAWMQELSTRRSEILAVDARYENGVAVSWR